jgi:DNA-binding LacI/PurR family transcriptional regulator
VSLPGKRPAVGFDGELHTEDKGQESGGGTGLPQRRSGHVTLLDVARACGFSVSTVSIVLSEAPLSQKVAEKTRQQIRAMAQQLGYHPDAFARSLRRRRSQTVGVLAYDLSDPYCIPIVRGIQAGLQPASYLPLLMDAQTQRGLFDSYLEMILERRAEGVIVIASWVFDETNLLSDVQKNNVPIVIVSRDLTERGVSSILVDNEAGGAVAMRHLHELGHRRIAVIRGPEEMFDSAPRWAGVQSAAAAAGIQFDPWLVFQLPNLVDPTSGFEGGLECAHRILASGRPFTAVLAFDDLTALGVVRGLLGAGLRVPEDCTVLGFDDVLPAAVATPGITTIRQPLREMGLLASEWVLGAIEARELKKEQKPRLHRAPPELVVRMSSASPAGTKRRTERERAEVT